MTRFLPTLAEAQAIVAGNEAFTTAVHEVGGLHVHDFGYGLPKYMDFEQPLADRPELKAYELRGLTFVERPDGTVSRYLMLAKFHALNQTTGHMLKDLAGKPVLEATEKLDGSLVRFIPLEGDQVAARTKSSFSGPHALLARSLLDASPELTAFVRDAHAAGLAPIFELISPEWKIVVPYAEEKLRLIQLREEATGNLLTMGDHPLVLQHGVETAVVPGINTVEDLLEMQRTLRGVEGWVLQLEDSMVKVKTRWYDDFHDFFFERNSSVKKMLVMVLGETMDDAMAAMEEDDPRRAAVVEANDLFSTHINGIARSVSDAVASFAGDPASNEARKAFTTEHRGDPLLGLYMQALKDPSPRTILDLAKGQVGREAKTEEAAAGLLNRLRAAHEAAPAPRF